MKLSIVIVNYNVEHFLENCLNSVTNALKGVDSEVFVVDNKSVDGSVEMVKQRFPQVKLIVNQENQGFSKANNQAIKQCTGEYILLLNPDTVVEEDTFLKCIRYMDQHQGVGGLGIKMIDGKGNFLPESKRSLPTPYVAFYKIFGLSNLFPHSKRFGRYHLGHLSKDQNHSIEILSGAYMFLRKSVLDHIGLLDENFFMYGEDIDLSYRIIKAGYENHYFSESSIIHYKGESTKKSSINYVFVFYRAMIIFAKKHFSNKNAKSFSTLINMAIYVRAFLAIITRTLRNLLLPITDAIVLFLGTYGFKSLYEVNKFKQGGSYPEELETYGIPIILLLYFLAFLFNGAYYLPTRLISIAKGALTGALMLLITYALLDEEYRFSRAIIVFTASWSILIIPLYRIIFNLLGIRRFMDEKKPRIAIVGQEKEVERISKFINNTVIQAEQIIYIHPSESSESKINYQGNLNHLRDIVEIYNINEIIFCAQDMDNKRIIECMSIIDNDKVNYKIAPSESLYIIGSNSIEHSGEYYIIGSNTILKQVNQQNKRVFDFSLAFLLLITSPLLLLINQFKLSLFSNLFKVLVGRITFVGFYNSTQFKSENLKLKNGILSPIDLQQEEYINETFISQTNLEYGRDYSIFKDLEIVLKNLHRLSRTT